MELVEIREYIVGQIVNNILITNDIYKNIIISNNLKIPNELKINGFLNITHKIEDNKLVEIKREEFEVGDIVQNEMCETFVITELLTRDRANILHEHGNQIEECALHKLSKIGIYDVNFEFKNKKIN